MLTGIADTHTVIWYIHKNPRLSSVALAFFNITIAQQNQVGLSTITLAEMVYLVEKGRIPIDSLIRLQAALDQPNSVLVEVPFVRRIAEIMPQVARAAVPDLPDRIIAATALHLGLPLLSRDAKIQLSGLLTIW